MYSKEEKQALIRSFWAGFADAYPRPWRLYHTGIKEVQLKFGLYPREGVYVALEIRCKDLELRRIYFEKMTALQSILREDYWPDAQMDASYFTEDGQTISRVWVEHGQWRMGNPAFWPEIWAFFNEKMDALERFYGEHEDYIKDLDWNT